MAISITGTSAITAAFPALDPEKQKKADEIKAVLQQTLDALKNGKSDVNAQRKAAAAARVAQIKDAIKNLRQFSGMDPKAMARMLAMLAKQLAAAVKDYKAAGGTDNAVSASSGAAPSPSATTESSSEDVTADVSTQQVSDNKNTLFQQGVNAYSRTQEIALKTKSGKDEDFAFLRDAKSLLGEMKGMIEAMRQRIKHSKGGISLGVDPDMRDVNSTNKSLDEVEAALRTIQARQFSI